MLSGYYPVCRRVTRSPPVMPVEPNLPALIATGGSGRTQVNSRQSLQSRDQESIPEAVGGLEHSVPDARTEWNGAICVIGTPFRRSGILRAAAHRVNATHPLPPSVRSIPPSGRGVQVSRTQASRPPLRTGRGCAVLPGPSQSLEHYRWTGQEVFEQRSGPARPLDSAPAQTHSLSVVSGSTVCCCP
jgi:hypothetical protein